MVKSLIKLIKTASALKCTPKVGQTLGGAFLIAKKGQVFRKMPYLILNKPQPKLKTVKVEIYI